MTNPLMNIQGIQNRIALKNRQLKDLLKARGHVDAKIEELEERLSNMQPAYADHEILIVRHNRNTRVAEAKQFTRTIAALHEDKNILLEEWKELEDASA